MSPADVQAEGLPAVMDRIQATGAQAIGTGLGVVQPVGEAEGHREPPLDIDGYERLLDRPLWGRRQLWLKGYRTYEPDLELYEGTRYQPGGQLAPPELDRDLPHKVIAEAHSRGMQAYVSVSPTGVPGLQTEDQVRYPHGLLPDPRRRVARQGCLNNPDVQAFGIASVRDVIRHFPEVDGVALDWVEYTVYAIEDHFACLCPHCAARAREKGYDWDRVTRDVTMFWDRFHALTSYDLQRAQRLASRPWEVVGLLRSFPGWLDLLAFKAETVRERYEAYRQALNLEGGAKIKLDANGWIPPFSLSSGVDYRALSGVCDVLRPKMHTFHWAVIPRWYGQVLQEWNPSLPERYLLDALIEILGLPDKNSPRSFAQYHIPAPDEAHPALPEAWRAKLDEVADEVGGRAKCYAYAHSYRPEAQWKRMIALVRDSRVDGMWVQRYGYLTDSKLDILAGMWR
jgi:hypothetical protein